MTIKKTVNIDELKENFPAEFEREHEKFALSQSDCIDIDWPEWAMEMAKLTLSGTGWEVSDITYSVSHSQSDHVSIKARFQIEQCSERVLDEMKKTSPMITEILEQGWMDLESSISIRSGLSYCNWEYEVPDYEDDNPNDVIEDGIYAGLHLSVVDDIATKEGSVDTAKWLYEPIREAEADIYGALSEDILYKMSEEYFIESAYDLDYEFEVLVEDDEEEQVGA